MKKLMIALLMFAMPVIAQEAKTPATLKSTLLQELRETRNEKNWFVTLKEAAGGLTAEQANWSDGKGNHSVGQLVYHLAFWNSRALAQMKGQPNEKFNGNNDETFTHFDPKQWEAIVKQYDEGMSDLEKLVESADDAKLAEWAPTVARIAQHNAYHIGEMVVVRKEHGTWNPETGVK